MKKLYVTYSQNGAIRKAVLDENLFKRLQENAAVTNIVEYENETLMERRFAEAIGVSSGNKKTLLD